VSEWEVRHLSFGIPVDRSPEIQVISHGAREGGRADLKGRPSVNGPESADEMVRECRRFFNEVAEHQVVAAAEDILTDGWISELELPRTSLKQAADRARDSERAVRGRADDTERVGDPVEILRGRRHLAQALASQRLEYRRIGQLLQLPIAAHTLVERSARHLISLR
jgi:hypothetical protein